MCFAIKFNTREGIINRYCNAGLILLSKRNFSNRTKIFISKFRVGPRALTRKDFRSIRIAKKNYRVITASRARPSVIIFYESSGCFFFLFAKPIVCLTEMVCICRLLFYDAVGFRKSALCAPNRIIDE